METKKIVFVGAGSHADAVEGVLNKNEFTLIGYFDDKDIQVHSGKPVLGKMNEVDTFLENNSDVFVFVTIGENKKREEIFQSIAKKYYDRIVNVISKSATILSPSSVSGRGIFIATNAFLGADVVVSDNAIVNTGAIVEHHTKLERSVNISPNATVNGLCHIGKQVYLGSGSVVKQVITIADEAIIGAGAVVVRNITYAAVFVGVPAKYLKEINANG